MVLLINPLVPICTVRSRKLIFSGPISYVSLRLLVFWFSPSMKVLRRSVDPLHIKNTSSMNLYHISIWSVKVSFCSPKTTSASHQPRYRLA
ncbi:hypothetical protein FKM82_024345 [Ascaphus truei]